jgi:hypothetical protein
MKPTRKEISGMTSEQEWSVEQRKHGNEIYAVSSREGIFIGEGYDKEERDRSFYLASIIVNALNENDTGLYSREDCQGEVTAKFNDIK